MISCASTDYRYPHGFWLHQDHGHQHRLRWQHGPWTSMWPPVATWTTDIFRDSTDHGHPHEPLASTQPGAAAQCSSHSITNTDRASGDSTDPRVLSRRRTQFLKSLPLLLILAASRIPCLVSFLPSPL